MSPRLLVAASVLLRLSAFLDGLGEMLHGVLDSVSSLGADAVDESNAALVLLSAEGKELRQRVVVASVGQVVLVGEDAQENACK